MLLSINILHLVLLIWAPIFIVALWHYGMRIYREEWDLIQIWEPYGDYCARTWRFIPGVY